ncbi:MAG: 30S ribosome-binding factor RbfA [Chromatiales bacterium]
MVSGHDEAWGTSVSPRPRRVAELVRRVLAEPLQRYASEAGLGMVTLSAVEVSPDLRAARLYVTQLGPSLSHGLVVEKLRPHLSALRTCIARKVRLRYIPQLSLRFDESLEQGARIDALLSEIGAAPAASAEDDTETR